MGKPYSVDLRDRVVTAIEAGMSTEEAAKRFCVSKAAAGAWARLCEGPREYRSPCGACPTPTDRVRHGSAPRDR